MVVTRNNSSNIVFFETPLSTLAVAGGKGVWDALFILYVVWPALLLYQIMIYADGYDALRRGIMKFSHNEVFLVVAIGWVISCVNSVCAANP